VFERDHKPRPAPKLNVVSIDKALGLFDYLGIVHACLRVETGPIRSLQHAGATRGLGSVGYGFSPPSAMEFVEMLNRTVQGDMTSA
jgi:hypothetical protein